ncbi:MAG: hypothetical protein NVSMB28_33340 [Collimonas sp.]
MLLLQNAGLIKLKAGVGENGVDATPLDDLAAVSASTDQVNNARQPEQVG